MNVLFIGGFQGEQFIKARNIQRNRSLAGPKKMATICAALKARGHEVYIASVGRTASRTWKWFPPMAETVNTADGNGIPVQYMGAYDYPLLGNLASWIELLRHLPGITSRTRFDAVIVYNCNFDSVVSALYCRLRRQMAVVLEHEDSALMSRDGKPGLYQRLRRLNEIVIERCGKAVFGPSPELINAINVPFRLLLEGTVSPQLCRAAATRSEVASVGQRLRVLYSGNLDPSKGVDVMLNAVDKVSHPLELHITGSGPQAELVRQRCAVCKHPAIFHGLVSNDELVRLQTTADLCINPHLVSIHKGLSYPFKVAEYLAACGIVISSRTGMIDQEVQDRLHLYGSDEPDILTRTINDVISRWDQLRTSAASTRRWALDRWGLDGTGRKIETLLTQAVESIHNGKRGTRSRAREAADVA